MPVYTGTTNDENVSVPAGMEFDPFWRREPEAKTEPVAYRPHKLSPCVGRRTRRKF